ncbi:phosphoenolpyruvate carboxylase family protein [Actinidia rufa]|uniref:Phosphoenolpyruvate carboxylase family protein n=1 Tax=Actinidia rufa TaxID=165716 RepID=A0A7J0E518_9ERIC|nr:phosphoenolpyruvate carboxylase family protein [Actinidia rufa]
MMKMMKPSMATRRSTNTISLSSISNSATGSPHQRLHSLPNISLLLQSSIRNTSSISTAKRVPRTAVACSGDGSAIGRESPAKKLRGLLESPGIHLGPACFDALSAKLIERSGFDFCFTTGFGISASRLGLPDTGFVSYGEMVDQGRQIAQAVSIPIIGDGDNGYGNAMNVKRTVSPKACGHTQGRKVVSREEAVMKIKAAVDARKESGSDIVIVARTDSRQAVCLEESIWRSRAFADAGADVLFH